jgi:glycosyltransferase involved in cell wall biosynthesis
LRGSEIHTLQIGNDWFEERQGGLNRVYSELVRHLPGAGVTVRGLVAGSSLVEQSTAGQIRSFAPAQSPLLRRLANCRRETMKILREEKVDLIAAHFALYSFAVVDRLKKFPTVIHFHGPWAAESGVEGHSGIASRVQRQMELAVYSRGDRFIVLSNAFQRELIERYRVREEQIRIVRGGVDVERFNVRLSRAEARTRLGWPQDRPILLAVRRQMKRMGLENLIDAVSTIRKSFPDVLLLLGGSGPIAGELKQRIETRGLSDQVRQLGRIEDSDLPMAYRAADFSVVPSQALEGFGMITLESLASGTPVLVTPVGGLPEVVSPLSPDCVFEDTTTESIAGALAECLAGKRTVPTSEECRAYAEENFAWPVIAGRTRIVYEEAIA